MPMCKLAAAGHLNVPLQDAHGPLLWEIKAPSPAQAGEGFCCQPVWTVPSLSGAGRGDEMHGHCSPKKAVDEVAFRNVMGGILRGERGRAPG